MLARTASADVVRDFLRRYERNHNAFEPDLIDTQSPDALMFAETRLASARSQAVLVALERRAVQNARPRIDNARVDR